jgi:phosphatidate cytidylyltransferase
LVLVGLLLPSLFYLDPLSWSLLQAVVIGIAAWEWAGLLRWSENSRRVLGVCMSALCALLAWQLPEIVQGSSGRLVAPTGILLLYCLVLLFWLALIPLWLRHKWALGGGAAGLIVGLLVLLPTWLALVQLRVPSPAVLLGVMALVWMADVAAYFAGRAFGKHKLAPTISPGKTWEGAVGALIGVQVYGFVLWSVFDIPLPSWHWSLALLLATAVSIIGDLYESMLKRQAGIKDSSNVLPGHGGVLDRIDSLTSTLPVVTALWLLLV